MNKKRVATLVVGVGISLALTGGASSACSSDADVVSENLSKDADNFKVLRRVVFYNGITDTYILQVEGYCSVDSGDGRRMSVTCKVGENNYKKHFLGSSDNVTWLAEQIGGANVSADHYKMIFKPSTIIPDIEAR